MLEPVAEVVLAAVVVVEEEAAPSPLPSPLPLSLPLSLSAAPESEPELTVLEAEPAMLASRSSKVALALSTRVLIRWAMAASAGLLAMLTGKEREWTDPWPVVNSTRHRQIVSFLS